MRSVLPFQSADDSTRLAQKSKMPPTRAKNFFSARRKRMARPPRQVILEVRSTRHKVKIECWLPPWQKASASRRLTLPPIFAIFEPFWKPITLPKSYFNSKSTGKSHFQNDNVNFAVDAAVSYLAIPLKFIWSTKNRQHWNSNFSSIHCSDILL